ncbi:MAG: hypothetical protein KAJ36_07395, partial [Candidatus Thorarchaeota archaeon]|nr:hypothetical protein [Candidatus Thorarchaeota archaeon]
AVNVTSDQAVGLLAGVVASLAGIVPLVGYGLAMIATGSHIISLGTQGLALLVMVLFARFLVPKLLKD